MADTQQLIAETLSYMDMLPTNEYFNELTDEDKKKYLFAASEEIKRVYPTITIEPAMVAMQSLYNIEGEVEGIAMMRRQNIQDYTVKDVKVVLKKDKLSPDLVAWLDDLLAEEEAAASSGGFGWLI